MSLNPDLIINLRVCLILKLIKETSKFSQAFCCCSFAKLCLTLCNPMNCSTPGFLVLHCVFGVCSNSCPWSWWCHPTISSSVAPFSSCPQSFSASGSFPMSRLFTSGGQSFGASASVFPVNLQGWFPLDWLVWSPCSPRDSQESPPTPQFKSIDSSVCSLLYGPTLTFVHDHWENHSFD